MAGDWIKMRTNLYDDPRTVRIACALGATRNEVVGALHRTWSVADAYTEDGFLEGYTPQVLDAYVGNEGWSEALESVGWLVATAEGISLPRFTEHNGATAKSRAASAKRAAASRSRSASALQKAHLEKRREEKNNSLSKKKESGRTRTKFVPPTLEEVKEFCAERKYRMSPEKFFDHFTANGWRTGKGGIPMKDWQAAVRNWERGEIHKPAKAARKSLVELNNETL